MFSPSILRQRLPFLVFFAFLSPMSFGLVAPLTTVTKSGVSEGLRVIRPESTDMNSKSTEKQRLITGKLIDQKLDLSKRFEAIEKDMLELAQEYMDENPTDFYREGYSYTVNHNATHISPSEQFLTLNLNYDDTLVFDASVSFRFKFGKLIQVVNYSFNDAVEKQSKSLSKDDLGDLLESQFSAPVSFIRDLYRISDVNGSPVIEKVAEFSYSILEIPYLAQMSYADSKLFQFHTAYNYGRGVAQTSAYPRSWVEQIPQLFNLENLNVFVNQFMYRTNQSGQFEFSGSGIPSLRGFIGSKVRINPSSGTAPTVQGSLNEGSTDEYSVTYNPAVSATPHTDGQMAHSMIYFHINNIITTASHFINPSWFNRQLIANANIMQTCNAYWDGNSVNFFAAGGNCANTGLSADVIYHEWGHGLDANTGGILDSAFSEGFGDIMALIMSRSPIMGQGFRVNGDGIRELATDKIYPTHRGEIHAEGLIIGSTFYDLLEAYTEKYGADEAINIISKYAFKMIYTATRYTDVYNALLVIDDNDANLGNLTPNFCQLNTTFNVHGLASKDARCP